MGNPSGPGGRQILDLLIMIRSTTYSENVIPRSTSVEQSNIVVIIYLHLNFVSHMQRKDSFRITFYLKHVKIGRDSEEEIKDPCYV